MDVKTRWITALVVFAAVWWPGGCAPTGDDLYSRIAHEDPSICIEAIVLAGRQADRGAIPALIGRLDDDQAEVRMFAIVSLEKITGQRLGYHYYEPSRLRRQGIERWRGWLQGTSPTATTGPTATTTTAPGQHEAAGK